MVDVIVVGARCAGAATAMLLARAGHRVLMLDKDPARTEMKHSTHFVQPIAVAQLRKWGLLPALEMACPSFNTYRFDYGFLQITGSPPAVDGEHRAFCPRRPIIDGILLDGALSAGVEYRPQTKVTGVMTSDHGVCGVETLTATGQRERLPARLVIGADGPGSTIAAAVDAPSYCEAGVQQVTMWGYWPITVTPELYFKPKGGRAVYIAPTSGGDAIVGVNWTYADYLTVRHETQAAYHAIVEALAPSTAAQLSLCRPSAPLRSGSTRNFLRVPHGPGWVLIGDAGHQKDPCTAQGITDAFLDAENCAAIIDAGLRGERPLEAELKVWHAARDARLIPRHHMTIQLAQFTEPDDKEKALYAAIAPSREETTRFIGLLTGTTDPEAYFAPENLAKIVATAA